MNDTPQGERTRIAILGRCNVGKSSLINALAGQPVAIVSPVRGTTTDPVRKAMEMLPLGPVLFCDTPGLDDDGVLAPEREERTLAELRQADIALLVTDAPTGIGPHEEAILAKVASLKTPCVIACNRIDETPPGADAPFGGRVFTPVSAKTLEGIDDLKRAIMKAVPDEARRPIASDLVKPGDLVILVVPIDSAAPKGRLILPQQQVIRDLLDAGVIPVVARERELECALAALRTPPALVITDSQAFQVVSRIVPEDVPLTSFSILFARYKGDLPELMRGAKAIAGLADGDRILVAEGCTHHRQGDDIGTVKIPRLLEAKTGKRLRFEHSAGMGYPPDLSDYALVVHCGGCMLGRREMLSRIAAARAAGVPIVNYGVLLACLNGILGRVSAPLAGR